MADYFKFKKFQVRQVDSAMKVGTDSVLLGAWVQANQPLQILDIGTGTGILALMLAQKYSEAQIDAIEIELEAAKEAEDNFSASIYHKRLCAISGDVVHLDTAKKYDLIITNPPYFEIPNQTKGNNSQYPQGARATARFQDKLPWTILLQQSRKMLSPSGCLALVLPTNEATDFRANAESLGWFLTRHCKISAKPSAKPNRHLMIWELEQKGLIEDELAVYKDTTGYTREYFELTQDYLLWEKGIPAV